MSTYFPALATCARNSASRSLASPSTKTSTIIPGIKTLSLKPSSMLRKLGAYRQQNRLHLALGEIGRVERSLFMLDWIEDPQLRRDCHAGHSKGEARHTLARAVFAHSQGRIWDRSHDAQQKRVMALNLVDRRDRVLEHLVPGQGRRPPATAWRTDRPEPPPACLALGLGAHRSDRRLRLEFRGGTAHQRSPPQPLSSQDPRVAPNRKTPLFAYRKSMHKRLWSGSPTTPHDENGLRGIA